MKKLLFFGFLAIVFVLPAKVTLSRAVVSAWTISRSLDSQKLEEEAAAIAGLTALRQKYFSVFFSGIYRYTSDKVEVKISDFPFPVGADIPPGTVVLSAPNDNFDLKMSLVQPLYSGGLLSNALKMEAIRGAAEKDLTRLKKIELAGKVRSSYFNYLLFCNKRDSLNFFLSSLNLHLQKVENLYAEELVKKSDLLETRTKADEIKLSLLDLEQLIAAEAVHFNSLCGYDPQEIDFKPVTRNESFDSAREYFLATHPLLRSLDERARIIQIQKKSISGAYLPQLNAFAELHYGRPGQNFFKDQWTFYVQGGLSVTMPVFNWNKGGRDKNLADIAARKLENQRADFIRESEKNLRQLYLYKESLEKKLVLLDNLSANAVENIRLKEKLYEENQIDHTDLLAAMTSQERYLSNREGQLAQMEMLKVSIDTLIGKCEEEE
ncbi:MAG: TolC family protein [Acidobacteria bacterium]|nr:TolC family protein [Acidobacteriota bacterium]MBU4306915.1 TolC family protein [Acidobacteriota bacterium]MCG2812489.1 TolC family protein [Candidatus Aminicenantes bacterium]